MAGIRSIQDVVDYRLCIGCGACIAAVGRESGTMVDKPEIGLRPHFTRDLTPEENETALSVCPGLNVELDTPGATQRRETPDEFRDPLVGRALTVWEGYASDPEIRYAGSSGGVVTALGLYCLERLQAELVTHVTMDSTEPWKNQNSASRSRAEVVRGSGSRYAPSAPCLSLSEIREIEGTALFVGKPCDAAAVRLMMKRDPVLSQKLIGIVTFFCAGTPASASAKNLLERRGVPLDSLAVVRYRGRGWPGRFVAVDKTRTEVASLSYEESWGQLQAGRGLRCSLCADGMGELADISCGDAWHRHAGDGNPGVSVIVARTPRGREIIDGACSAGYLTLHVATTGSVTASQGSEAGLIKRRKEVWGRLMALRLLGVPVPRYVGLRLRESWRTVSPVQRIKTILGTWRRVLRRGLWKKLQDR